MRVFAVALVLIALFALPPRPASAQNLKCDLASLASKVDLAIGDLWAGERTVLVEGVPVTVRICAPRAESANAEQLLNLAAQALPVLDELSDARLTGSKFRPMVFIDTATMYSYGADGFINADDLIHLHRRSRDSTVVHELAHYWSSRENFADAWMVEAYAEYLTRLAMERLGRPYEGHRLEGVCAGLPLSAWYPGMEDPALASCAYSAGPLVLGELAAVVGPDMLRLAIQDLSQRPRGVSSWSLLNYLEAHQPANLTEIMRGKVFGPEYDLDLARRATMRDDLARAKQAGAALGVTVQTQIADLIYARRLDEAASQLNALLPMLTAAEALDSRCKAAGLACSQLLPAQLPDWSHWPALNELLTGRLGMIDAYERIGAKAVALGVAVPSALTAAAAGPDPGALTSLQEAEAALVAAESVGLRCGAFAGLDCRGLWAAEWARGESGAVKAKAAELGGLLDDVARMQSRCSAQACGRLWREALAGAGIGEARLTVGRLTALADRAASVEERCGGPREACRTYWQQALARGEAQAGAALDELGGMLDTRDSLASACVAAGWPCADVWAERLIAGGPQAAQAALVAQQRWLPEMQALAGRLAKAGERTRVVDGILPGPLTIEGRLGAARATFAGGDPEGAATLLKQAIEQRETLNLAIPWVLGLTGLAALGLALAGRPWRGRGGAGRKTKGGGPGSKRDNNDDLLKGLLAGKPEDPRRRP